MKYVKNILEVTLYVITFLLIQLLMTFVVVGIQMFNNGLTFDEVAEMAGNGTLLPDAKSIIIISVISSVLTLVIFLVLKWAVVSRSYLQSRPWAVFFWVTILALGTLIPSTWLSEQIPYEMPQDIEAMLADMMHNRWGYLAIGILAPLAEELVFRGAVLRTLLKFTTHHSPLTAFAAILVSAVIFGAVHGNVQQFVHALLIGLILGWMYYRTDSIMPGVLFHWINNSAAYVIANLIPNAEDTQLVDIFGGDQRAVYMALGCSFCLILPALFQLWQRLKKAQ